MKRRPIDREKAEAQKRHGSPTVSAGLGGRGDRMTRAIDAADAAWRPAPEPRDEATGHRLAPLPLVLFGDLGDPAETLCLVRGVLGEKTLAVVYGEPKSGKSFLVTDAALHVALGRPWFGRKVIKGAVLVIAAEGHQGYLNRLIAFQTTMLCVASRSPSL